MKIVMGDISEEELRSLPRNRINTRILVHEGMRIYPCIGCMDCFGRRVGRCAIRDGLTDELDRLGYFEELELVSACLYGGFSPRVKGALDRLFAYLRPVTEVRKGETRFATQGVGKIDLVLRFYDIRSEEERKTAYDYAGLLEKTLNAEESTVLFYRTKADLLAGRELRGTLIDEPSETASALEAPAEAVPAEEAYAEPETVFAEAAFPETGEGFPEALSPDAEEVGV